MKRNRAVLNSAKRYRSAVSKAPETQQGELLIHDKRGGLSKINPEDVRVNGTTYGTYIDIHEDTIDTLQRLREEIKEFTLLISSTFDALGYNHPINELNDVSEAITHQLEVIDKVKGSTGITVDEQGYISDVSIVQHLLPEHTDLPDDLLKGYWKWDDKNKQLVLDEAKYNATWGSY